MSYKNLEIWQLGRELVIEKYSTVSSIVEKVKYEMKTDRELKTGYKS